ncbi:Ig-like domain-containing protein [Neolewinella persica]|uniref:Ig-like domain-containing protein n=1 Tax=Neolewinella persica TaxID=70998 RepID=UPI00036BAC43|nr:Ig-like domain-containing protein [Neolewinella persica]
MTRSYLALAGFLLVLLAQLFTLQNCATPSSPTGGERDTLGPVLIVEETTPNFQTNFKPEEIVLTFDEWVEQDQKHQIIISPPLELGEDNQPYLRRRSLVIPLKGLELRDSVTYVVNIGSAIKDLHEGNPTKNLRFVFATGPVLDSASVTGTLVEGFSGEPLDKATFTLYGNLADTATTTENPTYFAQTDEQGQFTVYNIRPGRYRAVGLVRNPGATNYFVDLSGTFKPLSVGFIDTIITVADGNNEVGSIRLSPVPVRTKVLGVDSTDFGQLKIHMSQPAASIDIITGREDYLRYNDKDTLKLFYRSPARDTLYLGRDTTFYDTLVFAGSVEPPATPLTLLQGPPGRLNPVEGLVYLFNHPLEAVDTALIVLTETADTLATPRAYQYALDTLYPGTLRLSTGWRANTSYDLSIFPGALTDWVGGINEDTLRKTLIADSPEKYGNLTLKIGNLDTTLNYVVRLLDKDKVVPGTERYINEQANYQVVYRGLKPATYRAEMIYDTKRNRRYDGGDFRLGRQPEEVRRFELEALRANWEVEEEIRLE